MAFGSNGSESAASPYLTKYEAAIVSRMSSAATRGAPGTGCGVSDEAAAGEVDASSSSRGAKGLSCEMVHPFDSAMSSAAIATVLLPRNVSPACTVTRNPTSAEL